MNLDEIVSIGLLVVFAYFWAKDHIFRYLPKGDGVKRFLSQPRFRYRSKVPEPFAPVEPLEPHMNGLNHGSNGSEIEPTDGGAALDDKPAITLDEMRKLARAIYLLGQGKSQKESLETAFECTKGGGKTWKRASELLALVMPE